MATYSFLTDPTIEQARQITEIYRMEGWCTRPWRLDTTSTILHPRRLKSLSTYHHPYRDSNREALSM
ncbi:MAG: hypothetical protein SV375_08600, partial [Thermodesulfobacteriota bacterium]|nr:hypothetical protein [Thermodesulfobacteriota bacterium]